MIFRDRQEAGRLLAERLKQEALERPVIIALPRGGVPVGFEVAQALHASFDVLVVRKISAPSHPEFGIGAVTEDGSVWIDEKSAQRIDARDLNTWVQVAFDEVKHRVKQYRKNRPLPSLKGKTAVIVDDGLATGVTARLACLYARYQGAERVILAIPVCAPRSETRLGAVADQIICLEEPESFFSVGEFYDDFEQISDDEVIALLSQGKAKLRKIIHREVVIESQGICLPGSLSVPVQSQGIILFAHGSGSSRMSPRNLQVAKTLQKAGFATLLFDLLTEEESFDRAHVFDIPFLAERLSSATKWIQNEKSIRRSPIGYFGASTGAGAALWAAAEMGPDISAIVSRGGRPDLAMDRIPEVLAPTLLIVGGADTAVIEMNREALKSLRSGELFIVPDATHLFEEPGALETVAQHATSWFEKYLSNKQARKEAA